jgi:stage IV sporulation protein FB
MRRGRGTLARLQSLTLMLRFSVLGFPVAVDPMFWIFTALLGGAFGADTPEEIKLLLIWIAVVFVSVLWHELGHTLMMRRFGEPRAQILLYAGGGLAMGSQFRSRRESILVSLAGPAAGFLLGLTVWIIAQYIPLESTYARYAVVRLLFVNIIWSLVNLLPVIPLDGGRVCEAVLGERRSRLAYQISLIVAVGAAIFMFTQWGALFAAIMFAMMAVDSWRALQGQPPVSMIGR